MQSIRSAKITDIPAIKDCAKAAYEKYVSRIGREPAPMQANFAHQLASHSIDVVENHNGIVGYIIYRVQKTELMLENVAVHPTHSGKGLGRALIDHVENTARNQQAEKIVLYTNEAMTENLLMYPRLGYVETHRIEEEGFKRVYFEKLIIPGNI